MLERSGKKPWVGSKRILFLSRRMDAPVLVFVVIVGNTTVHNLVGILTTVVDAWNDIIVAKMGPFVFLYETNCVSSN